MRIEELKVVVNEYLNDKEEELVDIKVGSDDVIEVEIDSLSGVKISTCCDLSAFIESRFDREKQDYELTVASYSVSSPFMTKLQFEKNVGRDVTVLMADGEIITANMTSISETDFTLEYDEKVAVEGKKRKELKHTVRTIAYADTKSVKLSF